MIRANSAARLVAALLIAAGAGLASGESLVNKKAPEFTRPELRGGTVDLDAYKGKIVLLNFWATWCAPCQVEMPVFESWQRQYGAQGLQIVGVSMDDDAPTPRRLVERMKLNYPAAMGDEKLGILYGGVEGLPLTLLIDRNGVVRAQFLGTADVKAIERQLKLLLGAR